MSKNEKLNRRQFIKRGTGVAISAFAIPSIVPASVLGKSDQISPSNKITMGFIGVGWMGTDNLSNFLTEPDSHIVAVCDVDKNHLLNAKRMVDREYHNSDCASYQDFRELLERDDIDAVALGLPDHWHAIPAIAAAKAGKDVYGEKPLTHTLVEGRAICEAVKRYKRIWQTGSWQRSQSHFRFACELVRNGRIGKIHTVEVGLPSGHADFEGTRGQEAITSPPPELDWDLWLGPAPFAPYAKARVHKNWRWVLDHGGGQLMDWVGHHLDIAHWGFGYDRSGPIEIEGYGEFPKTGLWNSPTKYRIDAKYANDVHMIIAGGHADICDNRGGTKWIGEDGWIWVNRSGVDAQPKHLLREKFGQNDIHLYESPGHWRNFLDCIKSRNETIAPCEVAHRSASPDLRYDPLQQDHRRASRNQCLQT